MTAMMEKLALERLELAPENLRQEPDPEALEALKASIREVGLLQGLVGYEQGGRVFVVAGGHRLRALKALAAEGHPVGEVPVRLVPREKALLLSLTENLARKDLDPLEEAEAVGRLLREGLSPEAVARELGRTPAWVRARGRVAEGLSPSWRGLLKERKIPVALAVELAGLPQEEQEDLHQRFGLGLTLEALKALRLKEAVPTSRALPGVEEAYLQAGGVVEQDLEGRTHFADRALFLRVQSEAAQALAERVKGELLLDVPPSELVPGGGRNFVVLYTSTGEVRLFLGVERKGAPAREEPPLTAKEAVEEEEAPEEGAGERACEAPAPKESRPGISARGKAERVALRVGVSRRRALEDEAFAKAALVAAMLQQVVPRHYPDRAGYFHLADRHQLQGGAASQERWAHLSLESALLDTLRRFAKRHGLEERSWTVEDLMALPGQELESAFRAALALLVALPPEREPWPVRLGHTDKEHLMAYGKEVLEEAAREVGVAPGRTRTETAERLLARGDAPLPEALLNAK